MTEEAPAQAPESTANTNPEVAAPAESTPAQPAETTPTSTTEPTEKPYFSNEQLAEMQKFIENNGGYDSAWKKMKAGISNPKVEQPQPVQQTQPVEQTQPTEQQVQAGHMTRDEFFALQYFNNLANDPDYANIADKIRNGDALKEMKKFGINPINGNDINDAQTREFLNMYAKANAPAQPQTPVTNTPTVEYVDVKEIKSMADVDEIMRQNITLRAQGKPLHPSTEAAKAFGREYYKKK